MPDLVEAVVLCGSLARGDGDAFSDVDIVAFASAETPGEMAAAKRALMASSGDPDCSVSLYSTSSAGRMAERGSLFMWHVRREGRPLFSRSQWLEDTLDALRPYGRPQARADLTVLDSVRRDAQASIEEGPECALMDGAVLYTVLRNAGIIASALGGRYIFGRRAPIDFLATSMGRAFPLSSRDIDELMLCRLAYSGKIPRHAVEMATIQRATKVTAEVVAFVERSAR